jgi:hypothetical protein
MSPRASGAGPGGRRAAKLPDAPFQRKGARAGRTAGPDPRGQRSWPQGA